MNRPEYVERVIQGEGYHGGVCLADTTGSPVK